VNHIGETLVVGRTQGSKKFWLLIYPGISKAKQDFSPNNSTYDIDKKKRIELEKCNTQ
jgi:hypothetical protein